MFSIPFIYERLESTMDIRHLQYFLEVARQQSFTKAAEVLYITQPTISKTVKSLEDELGLRCWIGTARESN